MCFFNLIYYKNILCHTSLHKRHLIYRLYLIHQIDNLKEIINSKLCPTIYCSDDWKAHQKKIVWENKTCVANCTNFKYKNNNMCYSTCPEGADFCKPETTYVINNNILTTNKEQNIENELNLGENNEEIYHTVVKDKVQNYEVSKGEEIFVEAKKDLTSVA